MSTENLFDKEAIEKLQTLVDKIDIGMLGTYPADAAFIHAVPMSRQEVCDQGNIWYLFSSESETFANLQSNSNVSILFSDPGSYSFVAVNGIAEVSRDQERIDKYWNKMMEGWFDKGKEDPRIRVLKVRPSEAHYWDTKSNKLVTFLKVAVNSVTDTKMDIGREGDLNI